MATTRQAAAADELSCAGPLECCIKGFAAQLSRQGYAPNTIHAKCDLLADLSRWLERRQLSLAALDERRLRQFQASRRRRGKTRRGDPATAQQLLQYLREHGHTAPAVQAIDVHPAALVVRDFEAFLRSERGLSTATVVSYLPVVRRFLHERFGRKALRLEQLRAQDLHRFVVREIQRVSRTHGKIVITALRSFLRFLLLRGAVQTDLARTLPGVATWRLSHLPRSLLPEQVERLLACCDRGSPSGKRDYAILLLLARLGLRGGEVLNMALEDLDWERGELVVRGKGPRLERLPLPADVGAAVARYLCEVRPPCATRRVFIRMMAPHQDLERVGRLLRRPPRVGARRIGSRAQGGAPVAALPCHQSAAPRRVPERDRSTAAPPAADDHADLCQGGHRGATRHRTAVAGRCVMSQLQVALDEYLAVRRALGYKLRLSGRLLQRFVDFADRQGATYITSELAVGMGNAAWFSAARSMGEPAWDGAPLCAVLQCATSRAPSCRRRTCFPTDTAVLIPTCTATSRSSACSMPPNACHRPPVCGPTRSPRSSVCTWPPGCEPTSHCAWTATMST